MPQEIERKFLVVGDFKSSATGVLNISQGYLNSDSERTVRVRIKGEKGFITVKGRSSSDGTSRFEWEHEIPANDAVELLALCEPGVIVKSRYLVPSGDLTFEVDVFHGDNEGLVIAEIELQDRNEDFLKPEWLGEEVTGDPRYYNSALSQNPFKNWRTTKSISHEP